MIPLHRLFGIQNALRNKCQFRNVRAILQSTQDTQNQPCAGKNHTFSSFFSHEQQLSAKIYACPLYTGASDISAITQGGRQLWATMITPRSTSCHHLLSTPVFLMVQHAQLIGLRTTTSAPSRSASSPVRSFSYSEVFGKVFLQEGQSEADFASR